MMSKFVSKRGAGKDKQVAGKTSAIKAERKDAFQFSDNRKSSLQLRGIQHLANNSSCVQKQQVIQQKADSSFADEHSVIQQKPNQTGLPDQLKSGIESLSGQPMDDVKVHYNSNKPAQLQAHAYAQGTDIHIASGQEKHLPHEAWHVVQQKQGRVKPTMQMKSTLNVNDDPALEKEADVMGAKALQMKVVNSEARKNDHSISKVLQRATYQLFRDKETKEPIKGLPPLDEMTTDDLQMVKNRLDEGTIIPDSDHELDLFLGMYYGVIYEHFPSPEQFASTKLIPFKSDEETRVSANAETIYTAKINGRDYFVKGVGSSRGAANEALVSFFAIRLGLIEHSAPTVWYEIDGRNFAVSELMPGKTVESDEELGKASVTNDRLMELFLFDYLVGSYDRIPQNVYMAADGRPKLIDNEGSLGLSGHGKPVKDATGYRRIGYKSAFLGAMMHRLGVYTNIFHPMGVRAMPKELKTSLVSLDLINKMINVGKEMITLMKILEIPAGNILIALKHLRQLSGLKQVTVGDVLNGAVPAKKK